MAQEKIEDVVAFIDSLGLKVRTWSVCESDDTVDGGSQVIHASGAKITIWLDGTVRVENADGTGYVQTADYHHHWGPSPSDNYDMILSLDPKSSDGIRRWQRVPTAEPIGRSAYESAGCHA